MLKRCSHQHAESELDPTAVLCALRVPVGLQKLGTPLLWPRRMLGSSWVGSGPGPALLPV